jgi:flagellar protein FlaJ
MSQRITDNLRDFLGSVYGDGGSGDKENTPDESEDDDGKLILHGTDNKPAFLDKFDRLAYRLFGEYFTHKKDEYSGYRNVINQARMNVVYNVYLSRVLLASVILGIVGGIIGIFVSVSLSSAGYFEGVTVALEAPGPIEGFFRQYASYVFGFLLTIISSQLLAVTGGGILYYIPTYRASERRRKIDKVIPSAVTFMYALSRGGMNIIEVMEELSEADDVYGEVANEFDMILRDMEYFGSDLRIALENASEMTPSENLQKFIDDLLSVIDSGGDVTPFLLNKSQQYHEIRKQDQKSFLDTLTLLAEAYVTAFVAAPLFIIVITTIMSMMGGANMTQIFLLVYGGLPIASVGFVIVIDMMATDANEGSGTLDTDSERFEIEDLKKNSENSENNRLEEIVEGRRKSEIKSRLRNPLYSIKKKPILSLIITFPIAVASAALSIASGLAEPSIGAFFSNPITNTTYLWVFPLLITAIPLSYFHERKSRKEKRVLKELPDTLKKIKSANSTGMTLKNSLLLVSETSSGEIADELEKVHNDVEWRGNLSDALVSFANRMKIPRLSRSIKLISKANESSGNIQGVLDVAARDVEVEYKLDRERFQNMIVYTVIIILTFLVFLFVIVMLDRRFLTEMTEVAGSSSGAGAEESASSGGALDVSEIPIETYRMVFFHASIIQAFTTGLIAGQMGENDLLSGVKYSIVMTLIALLVFMFM